MEEEKTAFQKMMWEYFCIFAHSYTQNGYAYDIEQRSDN